jgi:hypothetical protein
MTTVLAPYKESRFLERKRKRTRGSEKIKRKPSTE